MNQAIHEMANSITMPVFGLWVTSKTLDILSSVLTASLGGLLCIHALKRLVTPRASIYISAIGKYIMKRIRAWEYLIHGQSIIREGFLKSNGQPYEVFAPDTRYVFVSSPKYIKELDSAPDTVLSLQAASKQMLQPKYTMSGFNWFDRRGTEGVGFIKALRTMLTNNLPQVLPLLGVVIRTRTAELLDKKPIVTGTTKHISIYSMMVKLVVLSNAVSFFGEDLAKNENFMAAALQYIEQTLISAEIVRLIPKFLAPLVGGIIGLRLNAQENVFNTLLPIAERRVLERGMKRLGHSVPYHVGLHQARESPKLIEKADCIQWIMETSPRENPWSAKRVVHELMAIWFGSVHAVSTTVTFAIQDLCLHPGYVGPLRRELANEYTSFTQTGRGLPLLDSFIKESARLTPVESQSTRRAAIQPFTFSNGTRLEVGDWACTPVRDIMQDSQFYPEPHQFNGFRFVDPELASRAEDIQPLQPKPSKLTDADNTFHVWGTGRMVCPGRFYAAAVMKVIMGQMIMQYDFDLVEKNAPRRLCWRSTILPKHSTVLAVTPV
ncbi:hypothetical protein M434DRAFT_38836 [Hypoxylon sp. CO27-5]|nr:hypothetical protein M434DRAFT_38836 [Hypoxylon sp. CO27-5]